MNTRNPIFMVLCVVAVGAFIAGCSSRVAPPATSTPAVGTPAVGTPIAENTPPQIKTIAPSPKSNVVRPNVAKTILWEKTFERAQAEAVKTRKPIMVDFYTDWCSACKMMDAEAYTDASVVRASQKFVAVKVNAEQRTDLAMRYKVNSYPTILWIDADGKVLNTSEGYGGIEMLAKDMAIALQRFSTTV